MDIKTQEEEAAEAAALKVKEDEAAAAAAKGGESEHEPGPDNPRFKKVYYDMKEAQRAALDTRKDVDALRNQNRVLMTKLEGIEQKKTDRPIPPMPDIAEDSEAWKAWHNTEMNNMKKEFMSEIERAGANATLNAIQFSQPDYQSMAGIADDAISGGNEELKSKIYGAASPHRAAFEYGLTQRNGGAPPPPGGEPPPKPPAGVEGAGEQPPAQGKGFPKPSEAEARVIRLTLLNGERNPSPEKWNEAVKKYQTNQKAMGITPGGVA